MPRERQQEPESFACQQCAQQRREARQPIPGRNQPRTLAATNIAARESLHVPPVGNLPAPSGFEPADDREPEITIPPQNYVR